jgi:sucrose-6-phosphate hydrolase SacC (GH32 family)
VIEVNGTYHMYFWGRDQPGADPLYWYWDIGHATSSDGVTWVMDPSNPALVRGAAGWRR